MKSPLGRVLLGSVLAFALPALASVVVAQTIEEMTRSVPLVVRGRVGQVQASWDEGNRRIWTRSEIAVQEVLKGSSPSTVLVRQPGGEVGNDGLFVAGTAKFQTGEEVVLFLEPAPDEAGVFSVYALAAGKVSLETTRVGEVRAVRDLDGLGLYALAGPDKGKVTAVGGKEDLGTPARFLGRVRQAAGGAK
jgi:hypothetical protein